MKLIIKNTTYLFMAVFLTACATNIQSLKEDKNVQLKEQEGYLFLGVRTDSSLSRLVLTGTKKVALTGADLRKGSNYILVNLPAGEYEISRIEVGRIHWGITDEDIWSFTVKPNTVSYVGDLEVKRNWLFASFELINNSSQALEFLEEKFQNILSSTKVEYSGQGEDSFFETVMKKNQEKGGSKNED